MSIFKEALKELNEVDSSELSIDAVDTVTAEEESFARKLLELFQELIDMGKIDLSEEFTSPKNLNHHYKTHCLMGNKDRISKRSKVYYDFNKEVDYKEYELDLSNKLKNSNNVILISTLYDIPMVIKAFRKLFEGNTLLIFDAQCGFKDSTIGKPITICFRSFATNATTNYNQNTIDYLVRNLKNKTISLFPLDANYLENKFNNLIQYHNDSENKSILKINH